MKKILNFFKFFIHLNNILFKIKILVIPQINQFNKNNQMVKN